MRLAIALIAGMLTACATPASVGASAAEEAGKTCKRITSTDSNMPQRVCHTKEEWAAIEKQGRSNVEEFERARDDAAPRGQ